MHTVTTPRVTSVYSLRVEQAGDDAQDLLDSLRSAVQEHGGEVTDAHAATDRVAYVSISYRIQTSDPDALWVKDNVLLECGLSGRQHYLHTGLGTHRRLIGYAPGV